MVIKNQIEIEIPKIFVIGLAFATTQVLWVHFNGFVPIFLEDLMIDDLGSDFVLLGVFGISTLIGFVMTWDNIIAFFLQPYIGARSDRTRSRFGRRMPYVLIGIPSAAIMFLFIPIAGQITIWVIIPVILLFNFSMAIYRSPAVSLMPDLVPTKQRSLANGIVNLMGGLGSAIMILIGSFIYDIDKILSFVFGSFLIILFGLILFFTIKESEEYYEEIKVKEPGILQQLSEMVRNEDKSSIFMLFSILGWFLAWNAIEAFFTLYGIDVLGVTESQAQQALFFFAISLVIGAIPAGLIGQKIGRITTMRIGLISFIILLLSASLTTELSLIKIMLTFAGFAWALINVNSIVVVWEHARDNGGGTGLYYAFSSLAAVSGPVMAGILRDSFGSTSLFPFSSMALIVAFILLLFVKTGEAGDIEKVSVYLDDY